MVSWWKAEGNASDAVGGNNGSSQRGATFAAGQVGRPSASTVSNDFVSISDSPAFTPTITVEAWVNARTLSGGADARSRLLESSHRA